MLIIENLSIPNPDTNQFAKSDIKENKNNISDSKSNLNNSFATEKLFSNLSVSLFEGTITYIYGNNGSGKTSLLKAISGLSKNYEGKMSLQGLSMDDFYKPYCLYVGHKSAYEQDIKVIDQLEFWADSYNSTEMIPAAIEFWNLGNILDKKISSLSAGNAKKVSLSRLTCCYAKLWLLDEVETNLDELNLKCLHYSMISKAQSGGIILITSHMKQRVQDSQVIDLEDLK